MGTTKRLQGKRIIAFCMLLFCLILSLFPQIAYAAPGNAVDLTVQQTHTKPASSTVNGTFGYVLAAQNNETPMPGGGSGGTYGFTITNTNTVAIPTITYSESGIYYYKLKPGTEAIGVGFARATEEYTIEVYVKTNPSPDVITVIKRADGTKVSAISFATSYTPLATETISAPAVEKTVTGSPDSPATFSFVLRALGASYPMPAGSTGDAMQIDIVGSGTGYFGAWQYTAAGTYNYTVTELNTGVAGYIYDNTVYSIRDVVTDNNGQLVLSSRSVISSASGNATVCAFTNSYAPGGTPTPSTPPPTPSTPTPTPSRPTPTPTPTPTPPPTTPTGPGVVSSSSAGGGVASSQSVSESSPNAMEYVDDAYTPLAGFFGNSPYWSLLSLMMSIAGAAIAIITLIVHLRSISKKRDDQDEDEEYYDYEEEEIERETKYRKFCNFLRGLSMPVGILVGIIFLILDDLTTPMAFINRNTIVVAIAFIVQLVLLVVQAIVRRKKARPEYDEYEETT